ncbi:hypothetical protein GFB49_07435 [Epibacterium sp. SM1979]|uniref:Lipopolysaccharide-assembly, LptC-related n=1 Tax=Tritonibacter litoralis TaxID=2662264 RepID=A0A843YAD8_9RHOB|nr:hypothetical protein [Tritonibacter litoralis]MQQ08280.1 hypothetical protein [Tritonibacter litoralis]
MDRYSRMIALLKVVLPLAALVLLSTVFLISRGSDQEAAIPFAQTEIEERMRGQQVTGPFFAGSTADGDEIVVSAENTRFTQTSGEATATALQATIRFVSGGSVTLSADSGSLGSDMEVAQFKGQVVLQTDDGMRVETERLDTHLNEINAKAPGTIRATSPLGQLTAGSMSITTESQGNSVQILFNNGVKLVYQP